MELKLSEANAQKAFDNAPEEFKQTLLLMYPELNKNLRERIGGFADVCRIAGKNEADYVITDSMDDDTKLLIVIKMCKLIQRVFNKGEKIVWANTSQKKWTCFHKIIQDASRPRGFRLVCNDYAYVNDCTFSGARPVLLNREDAIFVYTKFTELFELLIELSAND